MNNTILKLLYIWIEIVMYIIASYPDCSQKYRDELGHASKNLQDEIAKAIATPLP